ncbi:unnamed protein product [Phytomonas sp. Hart1]|nr:unnamed protein product [Phytomonas sp. Hart1]|eukprot:CCW70304.1 unnamed protein product [Phytomonas sp. isolate Hart1]
MNQRSSRSLTRAGLMPCPRTGAHTTSQLGSSGRAGSAGFIFARTKRNATWPSKQFRCVGSAIRRFILQCRRYHFFGPWITLIFLNILTFLWMKSRSSCVW